MFVQSQGIMVLSRCSRHSDYANVVLVEGAEIQRLSALWSRPLGNRSQAFGFFRICSICVRCGGLIFRTVGFFAAEVSDGT